MNPYLEIDNDTLIRECIEGNADALGMFYTRFAPKMHRVVRRYVTDQNDAKDILHDGFVVAFTRLKSLRNTDTVEYWLATIIKNLSLQFLQAQSVEKILHDIPEVEDTPEFEDIIDLSVLESLIQKLPKGYQSVFRLAVLENKTHKEISKILGIAPNTSSSQLFHAKLMMRKLIAEYRHKAELLLVMLIALTGGVLWWLSTVNRQIKTTYPLLTINAPSNKETKDLPEKKDTEPAPNQANSTTASAYKKIEKENNTEKYVTPDTTIISDRWDVKEEDPTTATIPTFPTDSIVKEQTERDTQSRNPIHDLYAYNEETISSQKTDRRGWSMKIGINPGISQSDFLSGDMVSDTNHPWYDGETPPEDTPPQLMRVKNRTEDHRNAPHSNDLPVSVSVTLNKFLNKVVGIETGISYTYLHSEVESGSYTSECRWHYLGIPLKLTINNYTSRRVRLYATVGVQLDLPLQSTANRIHPQAAPLIPDGSFHSPAVWSVGGSYGINISITRHVGIFIEPTLQYHFDSDYQVPNAWTDNKLELSIPIGLRYNF